MRKFLAVALLLVSIFYLTSCETTTEPPIKSQGKLLVTSVPDSAEIYLNNASTGQYTPATITANEGLADIKLTKTNYRDTTVAISITGNQTGVLNVILTPATSSLKVSSAPAGAGIWIDGNNSNQITPFTFTSITAGTHSITLKLSNYADTTAAVNVVVGSQANLSLELTPLYAAFSSVKLWETQGTTASQPSGLDLSSGLAYGISSTDKDKVDIYYSSSGFIVRSASDHTNMTRETFFKVGNASDLNDGVDSQAKDGSWATSMSDRESNYVFLYDADGNYSKLKITGFGGGSPGEPAWVEVQWIYNKASGNTKF